MKHIDTMLQISNGKDMTELRTNSINHAVQQLEASKPKDIGEECMHRRDLGFLREARRILQP